ncbi:MAG: hypothetical protein GAS50_10135 [Desulfobacterales bacterium]|nr:hypothetical protein [Desulfobacterales bacterium]
MNRKTTLTMFLTFILIVFSGALYLAAADDDHKEKSWFHKILDWDDDDDDDDDDHKHRKRNRKRHRDNEHDGSYLKPVNNPTYKEECGACHFAYQPELLPEASWMEILTNLDDHFGESIELDDDSRKAISDYLKSNSAEYSTAKRAVKIMRSLRNHVPMRITDTPYIREKHHEISPNVFKRESIGSLSNCSACHTTAENGIYEDDNVKIPK